MQEFEVIFEGEYGMEIAYIEATGYNDLLKKMKTEYPDDVGCDAYYTGNDGIQKPLQW